MAFPTNLTSAVDGVTDVLADHLNNLEAKVGLDGSLVATSLDYLLKNPASLEPGHKHNKLWASDGSAAVLTTDATGKITIGSLAAPQGYLPYADATGKLLCGPIRTDGVNLSVGTTLDSRRTLTMQRTTGAPQTNESVVWLAGYPNFTSSGAINFYTQRLNAFPLIATGINNTGEVRANWSVALRNYMDFNSDDGGTLSYLYGVEAEYGHFNMNPAALPHTQNVYGLHLRPFCYYGTIDNLYDLYITNDREPFGGTVANHYAIYQQSSTARNFFAGVVTLGADVNQTAFKLDVTGEIRFGLNANNQFYTSGNSLNAQYAVNGVGTLWLNYLGYQSDITQFRDLKIGDGKNNAVLYVKGSTAAVGIGTTSLNTAALLHLSSTTKGFLPPVMTTTQKTAISSPPAGLVVYDSTLSKLCVYTGAAWQTVPSA
jgi:hypothetical protein